jgi:DNA-binding XRE family transcriptional regulator
VAYFLHIAGRMPIESSWSLLLADGRRQVSQVMDIGAEGSLGELIPLLSDSRFELDPAWLVQSAITGARKQSGLTRSAFAAALGVSVRLLDLWEQGEAMPPADRLVRALRLAQRR